MTPQITEILERSKAVANVRVTAATVLSTVPCLVHGIHADSTNAAGKYVKVYDGNNDQGELIFYLVASVGAGAHLEFVVPLFFRKGLYVVPEDTTFGATLSFTAIRE